MRNGYIWHLEDSLAVLETKFPIQGELAPKKLSVKSSAFIYFPTMENIQKICSDTFEWNHARIDFDHETDYQITAGIYLFLIVGNFLKLEIGEQFYQRWEKVSFGRKSPTFSAVPSLPDCLSRMTESRPYLDDFTSAHFFSSLKFSSKRSLASSSDAPFPTSSADPGDPFCSANVEEKIVSQTWRDIYKETRPRLPVTCTGHNPLAGKTSFQLGSCSNCWTCHAIIWQFIIKRKKKWFIW